MEFLGFIRPDGRVGVRNTVLIISTDVNTNGICLNIASSVLNAVPVPGWPNREKYTEYLSALAQHPNVAGAIVLAQSSEGVGESVAKKLTGLGKPVQIINLAASGGVIEAVAHAVRAAMMMVREVSTQRRQLTLMSRLILGLIYRDQSGTGDLLVHCIDSIQENHGRVLIFKDEADKKSKINLCPVIKKVDTGGKVDSQQGLYQLRVTDESEDVLKAMASLGVQLAVDATGGPFTRYHTVLPVVSITANQDHYNSYKDNIELDLSHLDLQSYKAEDYSLLIINEIIATASGKLTKSEALKF